MTLLDLSPAFWILIALAFFAGGVSKGVIGLGMPLIVIPTVASVINPVTAIALIAVPSISSNIWQVWHTGYHRQTLARFWTFIVAVAITITLAAFVLVRTDTQAAALAMGIVVLLFTAARSMSFNWRTSPEAERWLSPAVGAFCGFVGGVTGIFSPPLSMYIVSLRLPKEEFIAAMAMLLLCGAIPLFGTLAANGVLTVDILVASTLGAIPAMIGVMVGTRLRNRISQTVFERALLVVLFLIGLNLLRRGLF